MDKVNDGGPAFPIPLAPGELYTETRSGCGMTLRDWFAGKALAGLDADRIASDATHNADATVKHRAWVCYALADAMISERAKEKS